MTYVNTTANNYDFWPINDNTGFRGKTLIGVLDITRLKASRRAVACNVPCLRVHTARKQCPHVYEDFNHPVNNRPQSFLKMADNICHW